MVQFFQTNKQPSLTHAFNQGLGGALSTGFQNQYAQGQELQQQQQKQSMLNSALTEAQQIYQNPNLSPDQKQISLFKALSSNPEVANALSQRLHGQESLGIEKNRNELTAESNRRSQEDLNEYRRKTLEINQQKADAITNKPAKEPTKTPFEQALGRKNADEYIKNEEYIAKSKGQLKSLDDIDKLVEDLSGPTGYLKLIPGTSSKPTELENLSFASVEPILKIFNPTGQIAVTKMNRILDQYAVKKWDTKAKALGKTSSLRSLLNQGLQRAQDRNNLIQEYQGNPPPELLNQFDNESEQVLDAITDQQSLKNNTFDDMPKASQHKGKMLTNKKTGENFISNGKQWVPQ